VTKLRRKTIRLVEEHGFIPTLLIFWVVILCTLVVVWMMLDPEKFSGIAVSLGLGVIGLVGTVLAFARPGVKNSDEQQHEHHYPPEDSERI
jgi:hypothetical protein